MSNYYILRVWLTSIIVTPALFILLSITTGTVMDNDSIGLVFFMMIYGFILSLPTLGFCYLIAFLFRKKLKNVIAFKIAVILSALLGMGITLSLFLGLHNIFGFVNFLILYGSTIIVFGMLYKAKKPIPVNLN